MGSEAWTLPPMLWGGWEGQTLGHWVQDTAVWETQWGLGVSAAEPLPDFHPQHRTPETHLPGCPGLMAPAHFCRLRAEAHTWLT